MAGTGAERPEDGSALVVSLVFIILITILIVGFATTAAMERKTVQSHYARIQADLYASMGVDIAASRIKEATSQGGWWVSQPGRIAYGTTGSTAGASTAQFVNLTSGTASLPLVEDLSVDLNPAALVTGGGLVTGDTSTRMPVKWIYVRQDGSQVVDPSVVPAYAAGASALAGRYAFWVDDQSCRINLNAVASGTLPSSAPASQPSHLELAVLDSMTADDIAALRSRRESALFESPQSGKAAKNSPTLRAALDAHKMDMTHHSHSPDQNIFGESKLVLTTRKERADGQPFFDILKTDGLDPGINGNIDSTKYNALFAKLYGYLARKDWPMTPGKSFVDKYGPENSAQMILNLIDYVRSAEADKVIVEASRGSFSGTTFSWAGSVASPAGLMGNARRILITQIGVWISDTAPFQCRFRAEVFLPASAGDATTEVDLLEGDRYVLYEIAGPEFSQPDSTVNDYRKIASYGSIEGGTGSTANRAKMHPGQFRTVSISYPLVRLKDPTKRPQGPLYVRATLRVAGDPTIGADIAPLLQDTGTAQAPYVLDGPGKTFVQIGSIAINDPVINKSAKDWVQRSTNTFGTSTTFGASTLGLAASGTLPQQDADSTGKLTDVGFGFPAVKGSSKNPRGMVESIGELGQIHTGGKGTMLAGVPWRTLRLQPRVSTDQTLPDWALLNLFTVTKQARGLVPESEIDTELERMNAAVMQPDTGAVGGRINVNARLFPFADLTPAVERTAPLCAVLQNDRSGLAQTNAETAAANIRQMVLADGANPGRTYGPTGLAAEKLYLTPAQIAEVKGVADTGEESEIRLRSMLPFFTAQSSVFSVFSIGQKIIQLPNGRIRVLGESRGQALIERRNGSVSVRSVLELGL